MRMNTEHGPPNSDLSDLNRERSLPRSNWSRPLPRPLVIPDVMTLVTLADVRELIERRLPAHFRDKANLARRGEGFEGGCVGADPAEVSIALQWRYRLRVWNAGRSDAPTAEAAN